MGLRQELYWPVRIGVDEDTVSHGAVPAARQHAGGTCLGLGCCSKQFPVSRRTWWEEAGCLSEGPVW